MKKLLLTLFCCAMIFTMTWPEVFAQHLYFNSVSSNRTHLGLRYLRPVGKYMEYRGISGTWELNFLQSFSRVGLVVSMPYMRYSYKSEYYEASEGGIGNLFVGIQIPSKNKRTNFIFGMALPTASSEKWGAVNMGWTSDFMNIYKYFPETLTMYSNISYHSDWAKKWIFSIEAGPHILFFTGDSDGESEIFMHYGIQGGYNLGKIRLLSEFYGLILATVDGFGLQDITNHQISLGAEFPLGSFEPGIFYNDYLDKELKGIGVLGLKLDYSLN